MSQRRFSIPVLGKVAQYIRWWRSWRTLPVPAWVRGAMLYRQGRFVEAIDVYRLGLGEHENHPAAASARLDLAYCLSRDGRFGEAIDELRHLIEMRPDLREAHLRLARLHVWVGDPEQAALVLQDARCLLPFDAEISGLLLHYLVEADAPESQLSEALAWVEQVEEQRGSHAMLRSALGAFLAHRGQRDKALEVLHPICKGSEVSCEALLARAGALAATNQIEAAVEDLLRALRMRPGDPRALSLLARLYLDDGALNEPEFALRAAVTACQNTGWLSPRELLVLAEVYLRAGDRDLALMMAHKARECSAALPEKSYNRRRVEDLIASLTLPLAQGM